LGKHTLFSKHQKIVLQIRFGLKITCFVFFNLIQCQKSSKASEDVINAYVSYRAVFAKVGPTPKGCAYSESSIVTNASKGGIRIQAGSLKEFKSLVNQLSKPSSKLTQQEFNELRALAQKHGGTLRVDLTGVKGTGVNPHVHIEGLGKSVESRHIWLETGVK
jgi:hypothetical protein